MMFHLRLRYFPIGRMTTALGYRRGCHHPTYSISRWGSLCRSRSWSGSYDQNPRPIATSGVDPNPLRFEFTGTPPTWVQLRNTGRAIVADMQAHLQMRDATEEALNQAFLRVAQADATINPEWVDTPYRTEFLFAPGAFEESQIAFSQDILTGEIQPWRANVNCGITRSIVREVTNVDPRSKHTVGGRE